MKARKRAATTPKHWHKGEIWWGTNWRLVGFLNECFVAISSPWTPRMMAHKSLGEGPSIRLGYVGLGALLGS